VKYLAGAYKAAGGSEGGAVSNYARGYYQQAKRRGMSPYEALGSQAFAMQTWTAEQPSERRVRGRRMGMGFEANAGMMRDRYTPF